MDGQKSEDKADSQVQEIFTLSQKWVDIGVNIAHDCYKNGLKAGEFVRLSQISNFIKQHYPAHLLIVENGFLKQMKKYVDGGYVINMAVEGITETFEWFKKLAGETKARAKSGQTKQGPLNYLDQLTTNIETVDRLNILDAKALGTGEGYFFTEDKMIKMNLFHHGMKHKHFRDVRIARMLQVLPPQAHQIAEMKAELLPRKVVRSMVKQQDYPIPKAFKLKGTTQDIGTDWIYELIGIDKNGSGTNIAPVHPVSNNTGSNIGSSEDSAVRQTEVVLATKAPAMPAPMQQKASRPSPAAVPQKKQNNWVFAYSTNQHLKTKENTSRSIAQVAIAAGVSEEHATAQSKLLVDEMEKSMKYTSKPIHATEEDVEGLWRSLGLFKDSTQRSER